MRRTEPYLDNFITDFSKDSFSFFNRDEDTFSLPHGYYSQPEAEELKLMDSEELKCVKNFVVGNQHAEIRFLQGVDLRNCILRRIFWFEHLKILVYPNSLFKEGFNKPSPGNGLNVPAMIAFKNVGLSGEFDAPKLERLKERVVLSGLEFVQYCK